MLTDPQIDRYSRQIILSEVGGRGQELLLASRLWISAEFDHLTLVLDYLAGAGIGNLRLDRRAMAGPDAEPRLRRIRELNPEVRIEAGPPAWDGAFVSLILAGSEPIVEAGRAANAAGVLGPVVFARLDAPGLMAVLHSRPPCLACAHPGLLAPFAADRPGSMDQPTPAGLIAMAAAGEAIKLLLGIGPRQARIARFNGYEMAPEDGIGAPRCPVCA